MSIAARARSLLIRIRRRGSRSTQTPAGRVKSSQGKNEIVSMRANSKGLAWRTRTAITGIAIWLIDVPNRLTVAAVQILMKSGWRQRLARVAPEADIAGRPTCFGGGQIGRAPGGSAGSLV